MATHYGGALIDGAAPSVRVDGGGHSFLAATTRSTDLPTTAGAWDRTYNGGGDVFLARFTPDGTGLLFGTYVGGSGNEAGETHNLALDRHGNAYLAGYTSSADLPTTPGALQRTFGGTGTNGDGFVYKFSAAGTRLAATYFGGRGGEGIQGITADLFGNVYISGGTSTRSPGGSGGNSRQAEVSAPSPQQAHSHADVGLSVTRRSGRWYSDRIGRRRAARNPEPQDTHANHF